MSSTERSTRFPTTFSATSHPIALLPTSNPMIVVLERKTDTSQQSQRTDSWIKANPDKASAGTAGAGSQQHVAGIFFQSLTGTHFHFVPYRGGAPMTQDLMAGQIDLTIDQPTNSMPQLRAGAIQAYAVAAKNRLASAPDIPTVDESGFRASISRPGMHCGRPNLRRRTSSFSSTLRLPTPSPIRTFAHGSPILHWKFSRASSRRPRRLAPSTRPRSKSGGRSSRPPTLGANRAGLEN